MKSNGISEFTKGFNTKALHTWHETDKDTGAIVPPIHVSSTYEVYEKDQGVLFL